MGTERKQNIGGLIFVAFMFMGIGIGMLLDNVAAGTVIGMGIGFLGMAFVRTKEIKPSPITLGFPKTIRRLLILAIGILMIVSGLALLWEPELMFPYVISAGIIVVGLIFLVAGLTGMNGKE